MRDSSPLEHYVLTGAHEGRSVPQDVGGASGSGESGAATRSVDGYVPPPGLLPWFSPLNTVLDPTLAATPRLNVLVPGLGMRHMSGGPNTVLAFVGRLAAHGIPIRLVSTDAPVDDDPAPFWAHVTALAGGTLPPDMELVDAHDRSKPWRIGEHDVFLATAWWTAQQVKYAIRLTRTKKFVYFIQDFEPLFHAASTAQALAEETYALDYVPVLNTRILADFFAERRIGRFADPAFAGDAVVFEPALDRALFHPAPRAARAGGACCSTPGPPTDFGTCSSSPSPHCSRPLRKACSPRISGSSSAWERRSRRSTLGTALSSGRRRGSACRNTPIRCARATCSSR